MSRGTQLEELVTMLRAEVGHSTSVAAGVDNLPTIKYKLRRAQQMLYDDYDWPFLRVTPYKNLSAGDRYVDMPTELNPERIESVHIWYSDNPVPLERGITPAQYATYDSDNDERSDPVLRWDIKSTGDVATKNPQLEQVEVWPIPASNGQRLQFQGVRQFRALVADADVCDLDDHLIVLTAAQGIVSPKHPAAQEIAGAAAARLRQLKARLRGASQMTTMGVKPHQQNSLRGKTVIHVTSSGS